VLKPSSVLAQCTLLLWLYDSRFTKHIVRHRIKFKTAVLVYKCMQNAACRHHIWHPTAHQRHKNQMVTFTIRHSWPTVCAMYNGSQPRFLCEWSSSLEQFASGITIARHFSRCIQKTVKDILIELLTLAHLLYFFQFRAIQMALILMIEYVYSPMKAAYIHRDIKVYKIDRGQHYTQKST